MFARYLNVTTGLVSQWERGEKRPRGASLKLLTLVAKNRSRGGRVTAAGRAGQAGPGPSRPARFPERTAQDIS